MIEINLLEQKKPFKLPIILGIDLAKINYPILIISLAVYYFTPGLVKDKLKGKLDVVEKQVIKLNIQYRKLKKEIRSQGHRDINQKLEAFNNQISVLQKRKKQVQEIINLRTNPKKLMVRLAKNLPTDLWFNKLEIRADKRIIVEGSSASYKSIGNFILLANESQFFGKTLNLIDSATASDIINGQKLRVENYRIEGKVLDFGSF